MSLGILATSIQITQDNADNFNYSMMTFGVHQSIPESLFEFGYIRLDTYVPTFLHNGGTTDLSLLSITAINAEGVNVIEGSAPATIAPNETYPIEFEITLVGPTLLDASFVISTNQGDRTVRFVGIRAPYLDGFIADIIWTPNWINTYVERLEWNTDILTAYNRTEQRIALRVLPRRYVGLTYIEWGEDRQKLETYLAGRRVAYLNIPIWTDLQETNIVHLSGASSITIDTRFRDFVIDQYVIIMNDSANYDILRILSMSETDILCEGTLSREYPIGSSVIPLRSFFMPTSVSINRPTSISAIFSFETEAVYESPINLTYTQEMYKGYEVLPMQSSFENVSTDIDQKWTVLDNSVGLPVILRESIEPIYDHSLVISLFDREEIYQFKQFLYTLRGRLTPFWVESHEVNMILKETVLTGETDMYVVNLDYTTSLYDESCCQELQFNFKDGSIERRSIENAVYNPVFPDQETIGLLTPFDFDLNPEDLESIRFIRLVRLSSDTVTLIWSAVDRLSTNLQIKVLI